MAQKTETPTWRPWWLAALVVGFAVVSALLFSDFYRDARDLAVRSLTNEQRTHARQAARATRDFFATWTSTLTALGKMKDVADANAAGRATMALFYEGHKEQIRSITRVDEHGTILAAYPSVASEGSNISSQKHVAEILRRHEPIVSDVFRAVQGFDAVALHVPVFEGDRFKGSLAVVVNFEGLARHYFDVIKIGETGHAWVISRDGTLLYAPARELAGKSAFEVFRDHPTVTALLAKMVRGGSGVATYTMPPPRSPGARPGRFFAVYEPIPLGHTFWSVVVASSEKELLAGLVSFRNHLTVVIALVFIGGLLASIIVVRARLIVKEVQKRRQAEEAARSSERLRALMNDAVDQAAEVILMTDRDGVITYVNPAFESVYGYSRSEALGKTPRILKSGHYGADEYERFWQTILAGTSVRDEVVNRRADGTLVTVDRSVTPVLNENREPVGFLSVQTDVTARKRLEEEREVLTARMAELEKMEAIGTLAGGIAHDFNNILSVILSFAAVAERSRSEEKRFAEAFETIRQAVRRGADLSKQVLTFARRAKSTAEAVDLNELLVEITKMARSTFPRTIAYEFDLAEPLPLVIADGSQLHQAFLNLLINARDAMPAGGTIRIETRVVPAAEAQRHFPEAREPSYVSVRVGDTGIGMTEDVRQRIFEPFFTTKGEGRGTGLGLAVAYGAVRNARGYIAVDTEKDRGTTFEIFLPLPGSWRPSAGETGYGALELKGNETILFVEDEPDVGPVMVEGLRELGYAPLLARDGTEALAMFAGAGGRVDIVVSDDGLPGMAGRTLFFALRDLGDEVPFILASGFVDGDALDSLRRAGIASFLQKPYTVDQLHRAIRSALQAAGSRPGSSTLAGR